MGRRFGVYSGTSFRLVGAWGALRSEKRPEDGEWDGILKWEESFHFHPNRSHPRFVVVCVLVRFVFDTIFLSSITPFLSLAGEAFFFARFCQRQRLLSFVFITFLLSFV